MNHSLTSVALVALVTVGFTGCAADRFPSPPNEPLSPVFQSQAPVIEGQVVRTEDHAYIIRERSGRQTRVHFDNQTLRDAITVGDTVVARYEGPPSSAFATSITRNTGPSARPSVNTLPLLQTVEGVVQQQGFKQALPAAQHRFQPSLASIHGRTNDGNNSDASFQKVPQDVVAKEASCPCE